MSDARSSINVSDLVAQRLVEYADPNAGTVRPGPGHYGSASRLLDVAEAAHEFWWDIPEATLQALAPLVKEV